MTVEELDIVFDPLPPEPLTRFVTESLASFNVAATGLSAWYPVGFFLKSRSGEWLGGLLGNIWGGWLHVTHLWVASAVRRQRHGTRLLQAAEDYAVERGCIGATLETTSFEARPFYEKRGYEVFATLDDYPPGHSKFFLRKRLTAAPPDRAKSLLDFWFGPPGDPDREQHRPIWFKSTDEFDAALRREFLADYELAAAGTLQSWEASPEGALALLLLLDQVPRNIFRGTARAYATDAAARAAADRALERGFDQLVPPCLAVVLLYAVSSQREHRRPTALAGAFQLPAAEPRSRRFVASLRMHLSRGHRTLRALSAPQRNPWPRINPGRNRFHGGA